jgi:hypothetical protein
MATEEKSPSNNASPAQTGTANLANSVIALSTLREYGRKELIEVLDSVPS